MTQIDVAKAGKALRSYATHHNHGDGWTYTRDTGGLEHIRFRRDYTGHNSLANRIRFTMSGLWNLKFGQTEWQRALKGQFWGCVLGTIRARLPKDSNVPDGTLNNGIVITVWEEDGEYIEWVGPTVGVKLADFLETEPGNPHAIAIATEMRRVRQLGIDRRRTTDAANSGNQSL